jgi:hypothetical protein
MERCLQVVLKYVSAAAGHDVEVGGQDPAVRPVVGDLDCERGLLHLPGQRLGVVQVQESCNLLLDRRAALDDRAGTHIRPERAGHCLVVNPSVLVEAPVFDGDRRTLEPR